MTLRSHVRGLPLALCLLLSACIFPPWDDRSFDDDDDMTSPPPEGCSEVDLYEPDACEDPAYCGAASVEVGTGSDGWEPLTDGQEVPIWYGSQGGYHPLEEKAVEVVRLNQTYNHNYYPSQHIDVS